MLRRVGHIIALQFTAFVFLLFVVNGLVFLAADYSNGKRQTHFRLMRISEVVQRQSQASFRSLEDAFPSHLRERIRIMNVDGAPLYSGSLFERVPFSKRAGFDTLEIQEEQYSTYTRPIINEGRLEGYVQVADAERVQWGDLPLRVFVYLLVSGVISALTYGVGLFFARRSLKPAEQMMQRLEQFTQDASHELRTPLAVLESSLDLALKSGAYREGIASAKEDVRGITRLTERLLEMARLDAFALKMATVDVTTMIKNIVRRLNPLAAEKGISISEHLAAAVHVQADESLFWQAVENLITNAVKFTGAGGSVSVHLSRDAVSVQDTGSGIAEKDVAKIFDRFYQADDSRSKEGFGLGLSMVKRIVDLHGWKVDVKSQLGKGSVFTIRFR